MDKTLNPALANYLWREEHDNKSAAQRHLFSVLRYIYVVVDDLAKGELTLRAMSLVYTTLLSLVPLMAVSFSVLKAFGMHNKQLEPVLLRFLAPLGDKGLEITNKIIGFIDNVKIGVLGAFGIALLFYTAISLIQKIEATFNYVWRLDSHRSIGRRFADYGSVLLIGPLLVFSALGLSAKILGGDVAQQLSDHVPFVQELLEFLTAATPYVMIIGAFTFFYMFIPNTRVKLKAGLLAGVISGILFQSLGWGFGSVVVSASDSGPYAIYSGFAIVILFMIWMYISWLTLLVGSSIAFYIQHPEYVVPSRRTGGLSIRQQEKLALEIMAIVAQRYYETRRPFCATDFVLRLRTQIQGVARVLRALEEAGLITPNSEEPPRYLPNVPLETTPVKRVLDIVRNFNAMPPVAMRVAPHPVKGVAEVSAAIDASVDESLEGITVKDMAIEGLASGRAAAAPTLEEQTNG